MQLQYEKNSDENSKPGSSQEINQREKYWEELSADEKIARMRKIVQHLVSYSDEQRRLLSDIRSLIWEHSHEENGAVVIKISKEQRHKLTEFNEGAKLGSLAGSMQKNDKVYF